MNVFWGRSPPPFGIQNEFSYKQMDIPVPRMNLIFYRIITVATLNAGTPDQTRAVYRLDILNGFSRARGKLCQSES